MCDCEKASASDVHIPACAHGGYIDSFFFFFTAHICQCLCLGPVKRPEQYSSHNPEQQTEIKISMSVSDPIHIAFVYILDFLLTMCSEKKDFVVHLFTQGFSAAPFGHNKLIRATLPLPVLTH